PSTGSLRTITLSLSQRQQRSTIIPYTTLFRSMKRIEQEISLITDENIPFEEDLIATLTKEKATLKEDMKFETEEEKDQSEQEIEQKENAIADAEEEIENYQSHVKEFKEQ